MCNSLFFLYMLIIMYSQRPNYVFLTQSELKYVSDVTVCVCLSGGAIEWGKRVASIIMCWSVLILWWWPQTNWRLGTEKQQNTFDSLWNWSRSEDVSWVGGPSYVDQRACVHRARGTQTTSKCGVSDRISGWIQDTFGQVPTWSWCWPLVTGSLRMDVYTKPEWGRKLKHQLEQKP